MSAHARAPVQQRSSTPHACFFLVLGHGCHGANGGSQRPGGSQSQMPTRGGRYPLGLLNRWIGIVRSRSGGFSKKIKRWGGLALGGISRPRHQAGAAAPEPDWHQCHGGGRRGGARPRARRLRTRGTSTRRRFLREDPGELLVCASVRGADGSHLAATSVSFLLLKFHCRAG